jgi:hypothetical protein
MKPVNPMKPDNPMKPHNPMKPVNPINKPVNPDDIELAPLL